MCCDHGLPGGGVARLEHYRVYSYRALHQADSSTIKHSSLDSHHTPASDVNSLNSQARPRGDRGRGRRGARDRTRPGRRATDATVNHREHGAATAITLHPREPHSAADAGISSPLFLTPPRLLSLSSFLSSPRGNPFRHPCPRFSASLRSGPPSINLRIRRHEASRGVIRRHQATSGAIRRHQAPSRAPPFSLRSS